MPETYALVATLQKNKPRQESDLNFCRGCFMY